MDRAAYEVDICRRWPGAEKVPFRHVVMKDGRPRANECHPNVDAWVMTHADCTAVRGWVTYLDYGDQGVQLTAHSVVQGADGQLFDITPLGDERVRPFMRFVRHMGDDGSFSAQRLQNLFITCSCSGEAEK